MTTLILCIACFSAGMSCWCFWGDTIRVHALLIAARVVVIAETCYALALLCWIAWADSDREPDGSDCYKGDSHAS